MTGWLRYHPQFFNFCLNYRNLYVYTVRHEDWILSGNGLHQRYNLSKNRNIAKIISMVTKPPISVAVETLQRQSP